MDKKTRKIILILILAFFMLLLMNAKTYAATFSVNKSSVSITEDKSSTVTVNCGSLTGRINVSSSNSDVASVTPSSSWVNKNSFSITIKGKKAGTATITVEGEKLSDANGELWNDTKTIKVTVKAKSSSSSSGGSSSSSGSSGSSSSSSKSSNANLSMLGVTPSKYDFSGFNSSTTTYNVTVPSDVNSLSVYATTASSKAKYSVSGNTNLKAGTNLIKVKVTAEDGTTKTYTIRVTKEATEEEVTPNIVEDEDEENTDEESSGIGLESLEIDGYELDKEFSTNVYDYYVVLGDKRFDSLDELKELIKSVVNYEGAKATVTVNEGTEDDDFIYEVLITVADDDKEYSTYSIRFIESEEDIPEAVEEVVYPEEEEARARAEASDEDLLFGFDREEMQKYILLGSVGLILGIAIVLGIIAYQKSKRLREYEENFGDRFIKTDDQDDDINDNQYNPYKSEDNLNQEENLDNSSTEENNNLEDNSDTENNTNMNDIDRSKYEPIYRNPRGGSRRGGRHF